METEEQGKNKGLEHLKPYQFKKGQSGNPGGRPKGKSLKAYARKMLEDMTDEQRQKFFNGVDKMRLWEMAEGRAEQKGEVDIKLPTPIMPLKKDENG